MPTRRILGQIFGGKADRIVEGRRHALRRRRNVDELCRCGGGTGERLHKRRLGGDGNDGRAINRLEHVFQKTRGGLLLEGEEVFRRDARRHVEQDGDVERHLLGVADLRDLLRVPFLFEMKIRRLQPLHRLTLRRRHRRRHDNQV